MNAHRDIVVRVAIAVVGFGFVCQAQAQNWIVGASVGQARQLGYSVGGPIDIVHNADDSAYDVFGGYMFNSHFGVLGSYVDLGEANYAGTAFNNFTDRLSADGVDVSVVYGATPGSKQNLTLFGEVGLFDFKQRVHYADGAFLGPWDGTDSGTSASYGLGLAVRAGASEDWGFHVRWKKFLNVGDAGNSGHENDRSMIAVGVHRTFGAAD